MGRLNWTLEAQSWFEEIHAHIAADNLSAADATAQGIFDKAQILNEHPFAGHRLASINADVRILLDGHYRIAYRVRSDRDIDVLGVFHGALELEHRLDDDDR